MAFVDAITPASSERRYFPPRLDILLAWSRLFRSGGTFNNYVAHVQTATEVLGECVHVFRMPAIRRARQSVEKAGNFEQRGKMWIRRTRVEAILRWAADHHEFLDYARLFLFTYAFLLRLPSEGVGAVVGGDRAPANGQNNAAAYREGDTIIVTLQRRKNKPRGSRLVRSCWCNESRTTCPVHVLGPLIDGRTVGERLFPGCSAAGATEALRHILQSLGVPCAAKFRTHDLRRGHALDLQRSGASLYEILAAGEWRSPAFLQYLDQHQLEDDVVLQAHVEESDGAE